MRKYDSQVCMVCLYVQALESELARIELEEFLCFSEQVKCEGLLHGPLQCALIIAEHEW